LDQQGCPTISFDRLLRAEPGGFSFGGEMDWKTILLALGCAGITPGGMPQSRKMTEQVVREGSFELQTTADKALKFFTPEGERAWVKGWDPKPVYPPQAGVPFQANAVFRVDEGTELSLWTIVEANLQGHVAEYLYIVEGERVSRVRVEIQPTGVKQCRVQVQYVHTAISEKGLRFVASVTEEAFAEKMRDWQRMVSAVIR
jgi:hypothetical protein